MLSMLLELVSGSFRIRHFKRSHFSWVDRDCNRAVLRPRQHGSPNSTRSGGKHGGGGFSCVGGLDCCCRTRRRSEPDQICPRRLRGVLIRNVQNGLSVNLLQTSLRLGKAHSWAHQVPDSLKGLATSLAALFRNSPSPPPQHSPTHPREFVLC